MKIDEFTEYFRQQLSPLVTDQRTLLVNTQPSWSSSIDGRREVSLHVTFVNLPFARFKERRGGGAESENNRMLFFVRGFIELTDVDRITVEQRVNHVGPIGHGAPNLRKKTARPEKIAEYLATYLNETASTFPPNFTHEYHE